MRARIVLVAILCCAALLPPPARAAISKFQFTRSVVGPQNGGGEPSIAIARDGKLYVSYPAADGPDLYRSTNKGRTWAKGAQADSVSADSSVNVDQSGAVYQSNLNGTYLGPRILESLQASVYKSLDGGRTWPQSGTSPLGDNASSQPFLVDRPWADAWVPPGKHTNEARVYLQYHDFVPGAIWVNASTDGGRTFSLPVDAITDPVAAVNSFCNAMPGGVKVVASGPHAGRVYVLWIAPDIAQSPVTGCNLTQLAGFHQIWVAWSDDEGQSWTDHLVFDGGFGTDASEFWPDLTLDNKGNPYVAVTMNLGTEYDVWVSASFDGGLTWNGQQDGTGMPYKANATVGSHYFPAVAAGDPGHVVVAYLRTSFAISMLPNGRPVPNSDADAVWDVYLARSANLTSGHPTWQNVKVSPTPIHAGDICTMGFACLPGTNRNLLDFIDVALDPSGLAHIVYTDDKNYPEGAIVAANQTAGPTAGRGGH
jgi:hypothetical protein